MQLSHGQRQVLQDEERGGGKFGDRHPCFLEFGGFRRPDVSILAGPLLHYSAAVSPNLLTVFIGYHYKIFSAELPELEEFSGVHH